MLRLRMGVKTLLYHLPTHAPVFSLGKQLVLLRLRSSSEFQHTLISLVLLLLPFARNVLSTHQQMFGCSMTPVDLTTVKFNSGISSNREL